MEVPIWNRKYTFDWSIVPFLSVNCSSLDLEIENFTGELISRSLKQIVDILMCMDCIIELSIEVLQRFNMEPLINKDNSTS